METQHRHHHDLHKALVWVGFIIALGYLVFMWLVISSDTVGEETTKPVQTQILY